MFSVFSTIGIFLICLMLVLILWPVTFLLDLICFLDLTLPLLLENYPFEWSHICKKSKSSSYFSHRHWNNSWGKEGMAFNPDFNSIQCLTIWWLQESWYLVVFLLLQFFFTSFLSRDEAYKLINDGWSQNNSDIKSITDEQVNFLLFTSYTYYC